MLTAAAVVIGVSAQHFHRTVLIRDANRLIDPIPDEADLQHKK
ncbi:hypothetical protein [Paenibacillus sp. sgz302251]